MNVKEMVEKFYTEESTVELRYLEHLYLEYNGDVEVIWKSQPLVFKSILPSIYRTFGFLDVF